MASKERGPNLIRKYVWVLETIHRAKEKGITFNELNEKWVEDDISGGVDLPKRTFNNWRVVISDIFNIDIECNPGEFRYYIRQKAEFSRNGLRSWLYNTISVSNALLNSQKIKDRILLEYVPSGQDHLYTIIEAMKENRVINITYYSYWKDEEYSFDVQPYCVKLFRQRWYMVGLSTYTYYKKQGPRIYALDRIKSLQTTEETFDMPEDWSAEDYFYGCFGIIAEQSVKMETIKLKVKASQANYIRDLPMHESQKETERNDEYSIFEYYLRPQYDFIQELLWHGEDMEVLEPQSLRKEIKEKIKRMLKTYKKG